MTLSQLSNLSKLRFFCDMKAAIISIAGIRMDQFCQLEIKLDVWGLLSSCNFLLVILEIKVLKLSGKSLCFWLGSDTRPW